MWRQQLKPGGDEGDMVKMSQDLFKPFLDSLAWRRRDRESSMDWAEAKDGEVSGKGGEQSQRLSWEHGCCFEYWVKIEG